MKIRNIVYIALMAAICCILGPWNIPLGPIPISLGLVGVFLAGYILGPVRGTISTGIYILLGMIGLPVFTGFSGGLTKIAGPTGGYIIGYLLVALCTGYASYHSEAYKIYQHVLAMVIGLIGCYALGTAWFCFISSTAFTDALSICVIPFIPFDLMKIAACVLIGNPVKKALANADLLDVPKKKEVLR